MICDGSLGNALRALSTRPSRSKVPAMMSIPNKQHQSGVVHGMRYMVLNLRGKPLLTSLTHRHLSKRSDRLKAGWQTAFCAFECGRRCVENNSLIIACIACSKGQQEWFKANPSTGWQRPWRWSKVGPRAQLHLSHVCAELRAPHLCQRSERSGARRSIAVQRCGEADFRSGCF